MRTAQGSDGRSLGSSTPHLRSLSSFLFPPSMHRDLVLRCLEQRSAMSAKSLRRDPTVDLVLIEQSLTDAEGQLLGPVRTLVERLSPESAAELLTDPYPIHGYAQLVAFRSAIA